VHEMASFFFGARRFFPTSLMVAVEVVEEPAISALDAGLQRNPGPPTQLPQLSDVSEPAAPSLRTIAPSPSPSRGCRGVRSPGAPHGFGPAPR